MDIQSFRDYCLSLPMVTEATPFDKFSRGRFSILVFYVNTHMFCYFNIDDFTQITVKCDPAMIDYLKASHEAIVDPYNGNKKYWIGVRLDSDLKDHEILQLVRTSYELVKARKK